MGMSDPQQTKDPPSSAMKEEEGEVFKKAKKNLKGDQAKEIGEKFQTKKQELLGTIS